MLKTSPIIIILAMTTLHFVFLLLIGPKGFEAEGLRLIPRKAISYEHNFSNCVENPENECDSLTN